MRALSMSSDSHGLGCDLAPRLADESWMSSTASGIVGSWLARCRWSVHVLLRLRGPPAALLLRAPAEFVHQPQCEQAGWQRAVLPLRMARVRLRVKLRARLDIVSLRTRRAAHAMGRLVRRGDR